MRRLRALIVRLGGLFDRQRKDRELDEEMESHLQMHIEDNLRSGMPPVEARRQALIKLGGVASTKEAYRDQRGVPALETLWQDVRYGARALRKNPGFTCVAILTLALGIGANTAIFSVVNAVLLKPLPYAEPDRLVQLRKTRSGGGSSLIGSAELAEVKARSESMASVAAYASGDMTLTGGAGHAERVACGQATADFLPLLGIQPALGRTFTREEDTPNGPRVAILGHGIWQSRFGGDPDVLGRAITLNKQRYIVVGILPAHFQFHEAFQLWTPLALGDAGAGETMTLLEVIARLKPGVTLEQAQAELATIARRLQPAGAGPAPGPLPPGPAGPAAPSLPPAPGASGEEGMLTLIGLHEHVVGDVKGALLVLLGAVAFVLLIACANVANLMLARAAARQAEMVIRAALGAGRWRIARGLLTESLLVSLAGGGVGLLLAVWGVQVLGQWSGPSFPPMEQSAIDARVLAFALGLSVLTGVAFGLSPEVHAWRTDLTAALKGERRGDTGGRRNRLRHLMVVSEVALALVLLIGAGLLLESFSRLRDVHPGFRAEGVLTFQVNLTEEQLGSRREKVSFVVQIVERLKALPGVQEAAATDSLPLTHFSHMTSADIDGKPAVDWSQKTPISLAAVTPDYFTAMGIAVRDGRGLTSQDARAGARVVVVNESFEKRHFPGQSAVGKRIRLGSSAGEPWLTVVGIVADVRQSGLAADVTPEVYRSEMEEAGGALSFVLRPPGIRPVSATPCGRRWRRWPRPSRSTT